MTLANVYSAQIELLVADVPASFGMHLRLASGTPAGFPALDVAGTIFATIGADLLAVLASTTRLMRIVVRCLTPTDGIPYEANYDTTKIGTQTAEALPPSVAMLLRFRTASTNSRNNGHCYIPGVPADVWIAGEWEPTTFVPLALILATDMWIPMTSGASGLQYIPCVVSRFLAGVPRTPPVTFDIVGASVMGRVSQQRRRQSGIQGPST